MWIAPEHADVATCNGDELEPRIRHLPVFVHVHGSGLEAPATCELDRQLGGWVDRHGPQPIVAEGQNCCKGLPGVLRSVEIVSCSGTVKLSEQALMITRLPVSP